MVENSLQWENEIAEAEELIARLRDRDVPKFGFRWIIRLASESRRMMVIHTTRDHNQITGRLRSSIDWFIRGDTVDIGPTPFYSRYVYEGTRYFRGTKTHEKTYYDMIKRAPKIGILTAKEFLSDEVE